MPLLSQIHDTHEFSLRSMFPDSFSRAASCEGDLHRPITTTSRAPASPFSTKSTCLIDTLSPSRIDVGFKTSRTRTTKLPTVVVNTGDVQKKPLSPHKTDPSSIESPLEISSASLLMDRPVSLARGGLTTKDGSTFSLGNVIGRGQFGVVHRAIDMSTGRIVAVKQISLENQVQEEMDHLLHEVQMLQRLKSPYIVKYEGFVQSSKLLSIITEYVENGSLLHTLRTFGLFSEQLASIYTLKILDGLSYLHSKDVVHCDIKLANVLSTKSGDIKLSDFGISINLTGKSTVQGEVNGTPNWLAPEVISLRGTSTASDIWALGCTILEMITGNPPYHRQNSMSVMFSIVEDLHPPLPDGISPALKDLLLSCFKKEPRGRPTARELRFHPWIALHHANAATTEHDSRSTYSPKLEGQKVHGFLGSLQKGQRRNSAEVRQQHDQIQAKSDLRVLDGLQDGRSSCEHLTDLSAAQIDHRRQQVMALHKLTKSVFKHAVACNICRVPTMKALFCENCHIVAHPGCLLGAFKPCKTPATDCTSTSSKDKRSSPTSKKSGKARTSDLSRLLHRNGQLKRCSWQVRRKDTKEVCILM